LITVGADFIWDGYFLFTSKKLVNIFLSSLSLAELSSKVSNTVFARLIRLYSLSSADLSFIPKKFSRSKRIQLIFILFSSLLCIIPLVSTNTLFSPYFSQKTL